MMRRLGTAILTTLVVTVPRLALACPVCMAADARRESAYIGTTVLLSLLPLAAMGGIGWIVWRRSGLRDAVAPEPARSELGEALHRPRPAMPQLRTEP